jgi:hypothetical protein
MYCPANEEEFGQAVIGRPKCLQNMLNYRCTALNLYNTPNTADRTHSTESWFRLCVWQETTPAELSDQPDDGREMETEYLQEVEERQHR